MIAVPSGRANTMARTILMVDDEPDRVANCERRCNVSATLPFAPTPGPMRWR